MAAGVKPPRKTIFHALLEADAENGSATRSTQNLADEAMSLTSAAADSTGNAMAYAVFSVLSDRVIHKRVLDELRQRLPDDSSPMDMTSLEKLPFFMGVIKEAQRYVRRKPRASAFLLNKYRLSYGVIGRLPRIVPKGGAVLEGHYLPPGVRIA
jgi:hypothetical protein